MSEQKEITKSIRLSAVDTDPLFGIRRTVVGGSGAAATGSIIIPAGSATFKLASSNDGATGDANVANETGTGLFEIASGVINLDVSGSDPVTYGELVNKINSYDGWEAWLIGARPSIGIADADLLASAAAANSAAIISKAGFEVLGDTSGLLTFNLGLTENGSSALGKRPHRGDAGYNVKLIQVKDTSTFASGSHTLKLYECDDVAHTEELIYTFDVAATATEKVNKAPFESGFFISEGKRLVLEVLNSAALTAQVLEVTYTVQRVTVGVGILRNYPSGM